MVSGPRPMYLSGLNPHTVLTSRFRELFELEKPVVPLEAIFCCDTSHLP